MSKSLEIHLTPEDEELALKKAKLKSLEAQLADRELELASATADLIHFEQRYLKKVGRRYAKIDELNALIAEAHAKRNPQSKDARDKAEQARTQFDESYKAAGGDKSDNPPQEDAPPKKPVHTESLKALYRQAAKLLHPDLTLDGAEKEKRTRIMAELNDAYAKGDEERIRGILRDWHSSPESVQGEGPGAELIRVIRKIAQVEKRLRAITADLESQRQGELAKLKKQVDDATAAGQDLLKDLCDHLDHEINQLRTQWKQAKAGAK